MAYSVISAKAGKRAGARLDGATSLLRDGRFALAHYAARVRRSVGRRAQVAGGEQRRERPSVSAIRSAQFLKLQSLEVASSVDTLNADFDSNVRTGANQYT